MTYTDPPPGRKKTETHPADKEGIPWFWLLLGTAVTIVGCLATWSVVSSWLLEPPLEPAYPGQPTMIILTAPASPTLIPTSSIVPPTPIPTFTPIPTPDTAVAPEQLLAGYYATVANTDGLGLTVRGGPSTKNIVVTVAEEGTTVVILDGPTEADNFVWWQLRLENGLEGWAVADFLEPAAEPQ